MTIEIRGHVRAIEDAGLHRVRLTIQIEASRMPARERGDAPIIQVYASREEMDSYRPGMPIYIQVRPDALFASQSDAKAVPQKGLESNE